MEKKQAIDQIRNLFQSAFDRENYIHFVKNLLNQIEPRNNHYSGNMVPDAYKQHVNQYWRLGKYIDPKNTELDLYIIEVKSFSKLDKARTALRNFAVRTMQAFGGKEHALIAFYAKDDNGSDWRFSYVKIEHSAKLDDKRGKVKLEKEITPAKRYSFLVGEHENSHTAQSQLVALLAMDYANPNIEEIEKAFSIEKVTKEFFEQYKLLFKSLSAELVNQDYFKNDDEDKRDLVVSKFAKKLLGQIVFLYFLQKKGWLGVDKNGDWGKGDRRFLQNLFKKANDANSNYYLDKLQYLFYEALANDRKVQFDPSFYQRFDCRIPFLNGGLFEAEYDWQKVKIEIPNSLFSNSKTTPNGDIGDGILDVFDRYNFTIKEDEPLEKEVAVDPEMLGKVFENMLEITERKSKGAFYTPREVVHYMCQESLIHYLNSEVGDSSKTNIPKSDLEILVHKGIFASDNDQRIIDKGKETSDYIFQLPEKIRVNAEIIDTKLAEIKICDPAIGSGAFPLGILHEIIHARKALAPHLPKDKQQRSYDLKKHTIGHSIYGVDLDSSAIDIARLRLWLSLVVDEDDYTKIDALPNLDYKIMQGNSLIEEYEGVKLFNDEFISAENDPTQEINELKNEESEIGRNYIALDRQNKLDAKQKKAFEKRLKEISTQLKKLQNFEKCDAEALVMFATLKDARKKAEQLEALHERFFGICSPGDKRKLRDEITHLEWDLIEATLAEQDKTAAIEKLSSYKNSGEKPWFLWKLNFSEVFKQKGGFDIVIGNPPYLRIQGIRESSPEIADTYKKTYRAATGSFDLYALFMEKGSELICQNGIMNFINPDKWVNASFGKGIRTLFKEKQNVQRLISFGAHQIFEASTYSSLVWVGKQRLDDLMYLKLEPQQNETTLAKELNNLNIDSFTINEYDSICEEPWILVSGKNAKVMQVLQKGERNIGDVFEKIFQGIASSKDSVYFLRNAVLKNGIYEADSPELNKRVAIEEGLVKPLLMGDQIHRYQPIRTSNIVIFPYMLNGNQKPELMSEDFIKENYPNGYSYLKECEEILRGRERGRLQNDEDWFRYIYPKNQTLFQKPKLLAPDISLGGNFTFDENGKFYTTTTLYGYLKKEDITESYEFWMALLNSSLVWFYLKNSGSVLANGYYRYKPAYLENFPVPDVASEIETPITQLARYLLVINSQENIKPLHVQYFENIIDTFIYELYFPQKIKSANKDISPHLGELPQLKKSMSDEEKKAIIQREFERLYDPSHPVRSRVETIDSVEVVKIIRDSLKR
jgi:hypothetical protein